MVGVTKHMTLGKVSHLARAPSRDPLTLPPRGCKNRDVVQENTGQLKAG